MSPPTSVREPKLTEMGGYTGASPVQRATLAEATLMQEEPMTTSAVPKVTGPEVGEVLRAVGHDCGCVYENWLWRACPDHPGYCREVVLRDRNGKPVELCYAPVPDGVTRCRDHI